MMNGRRRPTRYPEEFEDGFSILGNNMRKKIANNTYLRYEPHTDTIAVKFHNTDVVTIGRDNVVRLNTGNWWTQSTKHRINACTRGFYLVSRWNEMYLAPIGLGHKLYIEARDNNLPYDHRTMSAWEWRIPFMEGMPLMPGSQTYQQRVAALEPPESGYPLGVLNEGDLNPAALGYRTRFDTSLSPYHRSLVSRYSRRHIGTDCEDCLLVARADGGWEPAMTMKGWSAEARVAHMVKHIRKGQLTGAGILYGVRYAGLPDYMVEATVGRWRYPVVGAHARTLMAPISATREFPAEVIAASPVLATMVEEAVKHV